jgi:acetyl-CoA C-acetyltransferase
VCSRPSHRFPAPHSIQYTNVKLDKIPTLRPAFDKDGSVTAANASTLNDGASALLLMSGAKARELGLTPLAKICGFGDAAREPEDFPVAPALAVPRALAAAGVTVSDIEYHEINEAFSSVVLANAQILGLDLERVNIHGGGVSLGHPIGSSGSRIIVTLLNVLKSRDATLGCASICNGGGGASAIVVERLK